MTEPKFRSYRCYLCPGKPVFQVPEGETDWVKAYEFHYANHHLAPPPATSSTADGNRIDEGST